MKNEELIAIELVADEICRGIKTDKFWFLYKINRRKVRELKKIEINAYCLRHINHRSPRPSQYIKKI
jgi:hypothetical protein